MTITAQEFSPLFDRLLTLSRGLSATDREAQRRELYGVLQRHEISLYAAAQAVDALMDTAKYFPKPAELREAAIRASADVRYEAGRVEPRSRLVTADGRPKCPTCGRIGPFQATLFDAEGNPRRWPDGSPWAGEVMTRNTMDHDCEAYLPTTQTTRRVPVTQGAA